MKITVTLEIECHPDQFNDFEDVSADMQSRLSSGLWLPHKGEIVRTAVTLK